jgi:antitoxin component of RelBE/YafQ-DinJ toxin-antitoxin module
MAVKRIKSDTGEHAERIFNNLNITNKAETMKMVSFKMLTAEKQELKEIFKELGLTFSSGLRFALTEFKRNHSKRDLI